MRLMRKKHLLVGLVLLGISSLPLQGANFTWNIDGNAQWDNAGNWLPAGFPNSPADVAFFDNGTFVNPVTISSTQNISVGGMTFNSPNNYTIDLSANTLFLDGSSGAVLVAVSNSLITISAPMSTVAGVANVQFNLTGPSSTVLSGDITALTAAAGNNNLGIVMGNTSALTVSGDLFLSPPPVGFSSLAITDNSSNPALISGDISGNASCSMQLNGSSQEITLSGNNSNFSGAINLGTTMTLSVDNANSFGNASSLTFGNNSTLHSAATFSTGATINTALTSNFDVEPGTTTSLTGVLNVPFGINKNLGGTLEIKSNNLATALQTLQIQAGTVKLSDSGAYGGSVQLLGASSILNVDASATNAEIGSLLGTSPTNQVIMNAPLRVDMNAALVYLGQFVGTLGQGELDLYGPQPLQIFGDSSSTMTGLVDIRTNGTLQMIGASLGGPVNLADSTATLLSSGSGATIGPLSGVSGSQIIVVAPLTINAFFTPASACSSTFSGNDSLIKTGVGTIDFQGLVFTSGNLNVNEGTVLINLFSGFSTVTVAAGARLGGNGFISAPAVNVSGTLAPGNSIGTTTIIGNVAFLNGSTFEVEFAGNLTDLLAVSQNVTINPGSTIQFISLGAPILNHVYTAIQASGTITGSFDFIEVPTGFLIELITSDPKFLRYIVIPLSFSSLISTGNPGRVAFYLDSQTNASGDLRTVILALDSLISDPAALRDALNQLHPAAFSAFSLSQENLAIRSRSLYSERANELFYTSCGCAAPHCYCHGVWLDLLGDYRCESEYGDQYGYKERGAYAYVGADCFTTSRINTGVAFGYARSSLDWTQAGWQGNMDSYSGAIYASDCFCGTLVDASLQLTYSRIDETRHIEFADISRNAKNDHGSWLWAAHLGLSQYYDCSYVSFVPFAYLDCVDVHEDHFSEHGADSIDLIVGNHRANLVRGELGLRLLDQFCCGCLRAIPSVSASVVQEWRYAGTIFNSQMEGAVGTFDVDGVNPDRTLFSPGAELLLLTCNDALSLTLRYEGEFGRRITDNTGLVKVSYNF